MNIRSSSYLAILSCFVAATTIIACKPIDTLFNKSSTTEEWQDISDTGLPRIDVANLPSLNQKDSIAPIEVGDTEPSFNFEAQAIGESVANDKAKLAATRKDKCPKLVNSPIGSTKIIRKNEVMNDSQCDYYIYPEKGQKISVDTHPSYIAADLVSPVYYDFANGSYLVAQSDKYVIRLSYKGIEYQNSPIDYDVTINVQ